MLQSHARKHDYVLDIFYSNIEGEAINRIYRAVDEGFDGLVMNPAGFTYAGWPRGTFWRAYCRNQEEAVDQVVDTDPVAAMVRAFMKTQQPGPGPPPNFCQSLQSWPKDKSAKMHGPTHRALFRADCDARQHFCGKSGSKSRLQRKARG